MASIVMAMPLVLPLVIFMVRRLAAGEASWRTEGLRPCANI